MGDFDEQGFLDSFFTNLQEQINIFRFLMGKKPDTLIINTDIMSKLGKMTTIYKRKEIMSQVIPERPVIRYFKMSDDVVLTIQESFYIPYMSLE